MTIEWNPKFPCPNCGAPYGDQHPCLIDPHGKSYWVCAACGTPEDQR